MRQLFNPISSNALKIKLRVLVPSFRCVCICIAHCLFPFVPVSLYLRARLPLSLTTGPMSRPAPSAVALLLRLQLCVPSLTWCDDAACCASVGLLCACACDMAAVWWRVERVGRPVGAPGNGEGNRNKKKRKETKGRIEPEEKIGPRPKSNRHTTTQSASSSDAAQTAIRSLTLLLRWLASTSRVSLLSLSATASPSANRRHPSGCSGPAAESGHDSLDRKDRRSRRTGRRGHDPSGPRRAAPRIRPASDHVGPCGDQFHRVPLARRPRRALLPPSSSLRSLYRKDERDWRSCLHRLLGISRMRIRRRRE